MSSNVNPSHYGTESGLQAIEVIEAFFLNNALRANSFKYLARAGRKDDELQDLSKALWYVAREILRVGGQEALSSAVKELPGEKTASSVDLLTEAMKCAPVHPHTYNRLGDNEKIKGVVYEDKDGAYWTWREGWECYDHTKPEYGWYVGDPLDEYGPYKRVSLIPPGVNE